MFSQQPDQKNLLTAIVLSMGVLLLWQYFYAGPKQKEEMERQARLKQQTTAAPQTPGAPAAPAAPSTPGAPTTGAPPTTTPGPGQIATPGAAAPTAPTATLSREDAINATPRVAIETASLRGSISLRGGRIDDLVLAKYRETVQANSPNVTLFSPSGAPNAYYAEKGWAAAGSLGEAMPDKDTAWTAETKGSLTPTSPVVLTWENGKGLVFKRTIKLDENYLFTITDEVENKTGNEVTLYPYSLISRHGTPKIEGFYISHEGLIGVLGEKGLTEIAYSELTGDVDKAAKRPGIALEAKREFKGIKGGWLGITDKYWAAAIIPNQTAEYDARLWSWRAAGKDYFQTDYRQPGVTIAAGAKGSADTMMFAGAKEVRIVDGYKESHGIKQFESIIDWGTFWYFTKPLYHVLDWLNRNITQNNFGFAILLITVLVKLLFFPLANKSYESMAKMKKLQPEMEKIRDRYKDDKARQQQEMMGLYQKEKINPLAGCLPILIQIPVFFALYKVLFVLIDLRHAPFIGWIKDLSAPDPTSLFNLFGLLPIPAFENYLLGYTIGAWAIVMGITMWLQMQLNPQQPDPMQQAIFNWMPVMFTVMLGGFASGLVIYWAWSNTLSIAQQYFIMKKHNVDVPLMDNLKKTLGPLIELLFKKKK